MNHLEGLKNEINLDERHGDMTNILLAEGLRDHLCDKNVIARAYGVKNLFENHDKYIYDNDLIAGSQRGRFYDHNSHSDSSFANELVSSFGYRGFRTNADHFAPDYESFLRDGIDTILEKIELSKKAHENDADAEKKTDFLNAAKITLVAFSNMIMDYSEAAEKAGKTEMALACRNVAHKAPATFREALQLTWLTYIAFRYEGRYAMAFGRMDQYLYPYYQRDVSEGRLTYEEALDLVSCTLYKINENVILSCVEVSNIAIGGVKPEDGSDAVNELSYVILDAVNLCHIPGPNLSARIASATPNEFVDRCLTVIGTGLGYPALMNDDVNIPALMRHGYTLYHARNYCMVGCIENFIQGHQPPWSDGRYNSVKYLELALNNGYCMLTGSNIGIQTGSTDDICSMDELLEAIVKQMEYGAARYVVFFNNDNDRYNSENYMQPFLSIFCNDCIERGLDINDGGAHYPSVHGACLMGIATLSDSLYAIEKLIFTDKKYTLSYIRDALRANYEGYESLREEILALPKYGNNIDAVDKYAVWFVDVQYKIFEKYKTRDGGDFYLAIASNVNNIFAGKELAATPDGRLAGESVSDAASPMHGMDRRGPTAAFNSLCKPDYTLAACGTVVNQRYVPSMFTDPEKKEKLRYLIRTYFSKGGQEVQINSVSRDVLLDAMDNPDKYKSLVVRVSGYSAYYTQLSREIQNDILMRTEHE